jgi:hypothetical protein
MIHHAELKHVQNLFLVMRVLFVFLKPAKVKMYEISGKCYFFCL